MKRKDAMFGMRSKAMGKVGCTGTVGRGGGKPGLWIAWVILEEWMGEDGGYRGYHKLKLVISCFGFAVWEDGIKSQR